MTALLQEAVEALRDELQHYGEMLALLEAQREIAWRRGADAALISCPTLGGQGAAVETAQRHRENCQRDLTGALAQADGSTFRDLIPLLPDAYRPLVTALVEENLRLLQQIRERAVQNHLLLRRSLDGMQQFIDSLSSPDASAFLGGESDHDTLGTDGSPQRAAAV